LLFKNKISTEIHSFKWLSGDNEPDQVLGSDTRHLDGSRQERGSSDEDTPTEQSKCQSMYDFDLSQAFKWTKDTLRNKTRGLRGLYMSKCLQFVGIMIAIIVTYQAAPTTETAIPKAVPRKPKKKGLIVLKMSSPTAVPTALEATAPTEITPSTAL
jgi:hypothetical protein